MSVKKMKDKVGKVIKKQTGESLFECIWWQERKCHRLRRYFSTTEDARAWVEGQKGQNRISWNQALAVYLEEKKGQRNQRVLKDAERHVRQFIQSIGDLGLEDTQAEQLSRYLQGKQAETSGSTARLAAAYLLSVARTAGKRYHLDLPFLRNLDLPRINKTERLPVPFEEIPHLLDALDKYTQPAVKLLAYTGLRVSALLGVKLTDLQPHGEKLTMKIREKGRGEGVIRYLILDEHLQVCIQAARGVRKPGNEYLFQNSQGRPWSSIAFLRHCQNLWAKKGLTRYCIHQFRHSFATQLRKAGADMATIAEALSHTGRNPERTTAGYVHLNEEDVFKAAHDYRNKLAAALNHSSPEILPIQAS